MGFPCTRSSFRRRCGRDETSGDTAEGPGSRRSTNYPFCFWPWPQVEYLSDGFLEKNRDTVYEEQINILKASKVKSSGSGETEAEQPGQSRAGCGQCQPQSGSCSGVGGEGPASHFRLRI